MRPTSLMPESARALLRSERGVAVPMVMLLTVAILALAGAAVVASLGAQRSTVRDQDTKLALAAADAGVQTAIERQNKGDRQTSDANPCVVVQGGALAAVPKDADGWCPVQPAAGVAAVGTAGYRYRVLPPDNIDDPAIQKQIEVVSVGASDNVSRRVSVTALAPTGEPLFPPGFAALSDETMTIEDQSIVNSLLEPGVSAASNEDVILREPSGLETAELCADVQVGFGSEFVVHSSPGPDTQCFNPPFTWAQAEGFLPLSPADQGTVAATNSNTKLANPNLYVGPAGWWDAGTRTLNLTGTSVLTVTGGDYSICRLNMSGASTLVFAGGSRARLFFDSPENCGLDDLSDGVDDDQITQMRVTGASSIVSADLLPIDPNTLLDPPNAAFLFLGSDDPANATNVEFRPNAGLEHQFVIWAPRSDVTLGGEGLNLGVMTGAVAAKKLTLEGQTVLNFDPHAANLTTPLVPIYHRSRYVDCSGGQFPASAAPNARC